MNGTNTGSTCTYGPPLPPVGLCVAFGDWGRACHWGHQWHAWWASACWAFSSGADPERHGGMASCLDVDAPATVTADEVS